MIPRVLKFGGSSVADAACMRQVARVVGRSLDRAPVVVLSAMGKSTDALFTLARTARAGEVDTALAQADALVRRHEQALSELCGERSAPDGLRELRLELESMIRGVALLRELSPRSMDALASLGERLSTRVFAAFLASSEVPTTLFDAREVIATDATYGCAVPQGALLRSRVAERLAPLLAPGRVVVTQGYIGAAPDGSTTTLGRGGSDYSAALLGAALGVDDIQIWTDVEGVLSADPRVVPAARPIARLSFAEAAELAAFGAKVLHPATVQPAVDAGIPVTVRHTMRPDGAFTTITAEPVSIGRAVTALASRAPVTVLTVRSSRMLAQSGFLARLFEVFGRHGVSIDLVATAEVSVSLTVDHDAPIAPVLTELRSFASVDVAERRAIVAVLGERLSSTAGLGAQVFAALGDINVEMISHGASEINLSLVVKAEHAGLAVQRLHRAFVE